LAAVFLDTVCLNKNGGVLVSVSGYFSKKSGELRMARRRNERDGLGIRWNGSVVSGEMSVQEAHRRIELQVWMKGRPAGPVESAREETDAVLRGHIQGKSK
jgi:hypothetical protein